MGCDVCADYGVVGVMKEQAPPSASLLELHQELSYLMYRISSMIECRLYENAAKALPEAIRLCERAEKLHSAKG